MISWILIGAMFVLLLVMLSRSGKKRAAAMEAQRETMRKEMEPGAWVRTSAGYFGKVVEVSGEVVTLENLTGEETLWDIRAIAEVREPDFGTAAEETPESVQEGDSPDLEKKDEDTPTAEGKQESGFEPNI